MTTEQQTEPKKYEHTHDRNKAKTEALLAEEPPPPHEMNDDELFDDQTSQKHVWEKMAHESPTAFNSFVVFRDMGPDRSIKNASIILKKGYSTLMHYARDFRWHKRVAAYDDHISSVRLALKKKAIKEMEDRQASHSQALAKALMVAVKELTERVRDNDFGDIKEIPFTKLYELVQKTANIYGNVVKTERLAMGVSTEITQQDITSANKPINIEFDDFKTKMLDMVATSSPEMKNKVLETLDSMVND